MKKRLKINQKNKYYFTTKDLVTIAIISSLGGVLSTYVGYLGNLINRFFGVPFGAGQFMAGLHMFWVIFAIGMLNKKGTGTFVGILKGFVEFLSGGKLGLFVIILSGIQGLIADLSFLPFKKDSTAGYIVAGGLSTAANVFIFQIFFAPYEALPLFLAISVVALISGFVFAGVFPKNVVELFKVKSNDEGKKVSLKRSITLGIIGILALGAASYYLTQPLGKDGIDISGNVDIPYTFYPQNFRNEEVTINAELKGDYTYVGHKDYNGIPLNSIIKKSNPQGNKIRIIAKDLYEVSFSLEEIYGNNEVIITENNGSFTLVAKGYAGGYWIRDINRIVIE
ncbi:MAG: ABC-type cobalt transport system, permease component [Candidatus Methanofastidiosum methylothiophilum]|uniref:ABC-type cobalt transport system, permease component n=1 Tax=Candidatus Methanofastidiosum methylothiophilum TaxID=1705564 RepID=A0A150IQN6_9EURY|nr:MAG: ABC-type cobalt transport system, permease component [Candidatus Methanofastidiosum methylthiophilus]KYC47293.1 MAG: ABC-type cobalt transport system, permease component [Candidatus Methanofastidiosum methylthiophilus]KYC49750.1 MAG: ABC-type cobalt transport system, permease component [Candidatus Methanofastidiosum methylthiophilus]